MSDARRRPTSALPSRGLRCADRAHGCAGGEGRAAPRAFRCSGRAQAVRRRPGLGVGLDVRHAGDGGAARADAGGSRSGRDGGNVPSRSRRLVAAGGAGAGRRARRCWRTRSATGFISTVSRAHVRSSESRSASSAWRGSSTGRLRRCCRNGRRGNGARERGPLKTSRHASRRSRARPRPGRCRRTCPGLRSRLQSGSGKKNSGSGRKNSGSGQKKSGYGQKESGGQKNNGSGRRNSGYGKKKSGYGQR